MAGSEVLLDDDALLLHPRNSSAVNSGVLRLTSATGAFPLDGTANSSGC